MVLARRIRDCGGWRGAAATGRPGLNLDSWAMPPALLDAVAAQAAEGAELLVAEGAMGLFDGVPAAPGRTGAGADVAALQDWDIPAFPLKGGQLVARGVGAGPEVARTLRRIEDRWIAEGFPGESRVHAMIDEELEGRDA